MGSGGSGQSAKITVAPAWRFEREIRVSFRFLCFLCGFFMPGTRKHTKAQREARLVRIAEMHAQEMSQADIAKVLGFTQQQISYDLKEIYRRWGVTDRAVLLAQRERILTKVRLHERAARVAWERSQTTKETTSQKQIKTPGGVSGAGEDAKVEPDRERQEVFMVRSPQKLEVYFEVYGDASRPQISALLSFFS
jgi:DNA-binding CsgD family transcriptional regulator